ncbi:MAG: FAD-dependent oxidoreductase [Sulfurimonadaceae bacterium]|nr:FAD-dependent oxidoreductase [Sulfurimonadaceae bacterium]
MYDVAIVGGGINGACVAYELREKKVALFDMGGIASGGSGAAGAFISPKFSKEGELRELLHDAFLYSLDFYETNFPHLLKKAPLLHIAKEDTDAEIISEYKKTTPLQLLTPSKEILENIVTPLKEYISIEAGIVDAYAMCNALAKYADVFKQEVQSLRFDDGFWIINETYCAKEVVLAIGAYKPLLEEPYNPIRGIWGHRIDIKTSTKNAISYHQFVSIAPESNGVVAIGATHNVHYHPQKNEEPYNLEEGRAELLHKASLTLKLEEIEIVKDYTGLRSGSVDYMPLVGPVVMAQVSRDAKAQRFDKKIIDYTLLDYYPNLTMINGNGGYGFVLAPYLAKILAGYILGAKEIPDGISPARFFARWARRS